MATDQVPAGVSRIVKTARSAPITLTSGEQTIVDVLWPSPFVDDNYTVHISLELPTLDQTLVSYAQVYTFRKKADHSGISVDVESFDPSASLNVIIHATATHD